MGLLDGEVAVVTGGASGIGRALVDRCAAEGARVVSLDLARGEGSVEGGLGKGRPDASPGEGSVEGGPREGGLGKGRPDASPGEGSVDGSPREPSPDASLREWSLDVTDELAVRATVERIEAEVGPIGIWCSNAGIPTGPGLGDDADWDRAWRVHVLAHVYAARHVLPRMVERGSGRFLLTASAAGLLTEMDTAPYSVTKHGTVALAEWLAIRYGGSGVHVSCLCPQAVRTPMTAGMGADSSTLAAAPPIEPSVVADAVIEAFVDRRFLVLPHPEVAEYERRRAADRDRWLAGMRRVYTSLRERTREATVSKGQHPKEA